MSARVVRRLSLVPAADPRLPQRAAAPLKMRAPLELFELFKLDEAIPPELIELITVYRKAKPSSRCLALRMLRNSAAAADPCTRRCPLANNDETCFDCPARAVFYWQYPKERETP